MRNRLFLVPLLLSAGALGVLSAPVSATAQVSASQFEQGGGQAYRGGDRRASRVRGLPEAAKPPANVHTFVVRQVRIEGSSLPPSTLEPAWRPFIGAATDSAGLLKLNDALEAVYARSDVALFTVVIPSQDFSDGLVSVVVTEAYVQQVDVDEDAGSKTAQRLRSLGSHLLGERPLRRSTMERYAALIRETSGATPDLKFTPGDAIGAEHLVITPKAEPFALGLGLNNRGTVYLGRTQAQVDAYARSLLRPGDQTHVGVDFSTDLNRLQSYSVSHLTPIGSDGTTLEGSGSYLHTRPEGAEVSGHAISAGLNLGHPLIRRDGRSLTVNLGVDGLNNDNALIGRRASNEHTRAARASAAFSLSGARQSFQTSATVSLGLDALGARVEDPQLSKLDFRKLNLRAGYNRNLTTSLIVRLNGAAQLSPDRLPISEQFALGGDEFGRAYEASYVVGDEGYAGSAELALRSKDLPKGLAGSELFVFADRGEVWYRSRLGLPGVTYSISSVGGGARAALNGRTSLQIEADRGLEDPVPLEDQRSWRVVLSIHTLL